MNIAIDISPLRVGHFLQHRVRGTGFYIANLSEALKKYFPQNNYLPFVRGDKLGNVDLVHYPYFEPFFITLPFRSANKFVVTVHDLTPLVFPKSFPAGFKGKLKWKLQKRALKKAAAIITDSNSSKIDIARFTGIDKEKIVVVYLAAGQEFRSIKDSKEAEKVRDRFNLPGKFVLYVGDVTWNKNLPRLIEATKKAGIPLVMVGNALKQEKFDEKNPWNQDLLKVKNMVRDDKSIYILGFVESKDLIALYNLATVFAMPSLYEGFGLPILEAMSCGCPVLTSKEGSIPEIAGSAAFYVDAYNPESIAQGLSKVVDDPKLAKSLSEKGLIQANKFSWESTAIKTIKVYEKVLQAD